MTLFRQLVKEEVAREVHKLLRTGEVPISPRLGVIFDTISVNAR